MKKIINELIMKYGHVSLLLSLSSNELKKLYAMSEDDAINRINELDKDNNDKKILTLNTIFYN